MSYLKESIGMIIGFYNNKTGFILLKKFEKMIKISN